MQSPARPRRLAHRAPAGHGREGILFVGVASLLGTWLAIGLLAPLAVAAPVVSVAGAAGISLTAAPTAGVAPLLVGFTLTVPNASAASFAWAFGDHAYYNGSGGQYLDPSHEYLAPGQYRAMVTVSWLSGSLNASLPIVVTAPHLAVAIIAAPVNTSEPLTFTGVPTGGTGTYVEYGWTFGDGTNGSGVTVLHAYAAPGNYTVELTVADSFGDVASLEEQVTAVRPAAPAATDPAAAAMKFPAPEVVAVATVAVAAGALLTSLGWAWAGRRARAREGLRISAPTTTLSGLASTGAPPAPSPVLNVEGDLPSLTGAERMPPNGPTVLEGPGRVASAGGSSRPIPGADSMVLAERRRLTQQLVVRLSRLPRVRPGDIFTAEWTQAGIAEALDVGQGAVSKVLRRLVLAGFIESQVAHVPGSTRRVRVYYLTARGELFGRSLRATRYSTSTPTGTAGRTGESDTVP